LGVRGEPKRIWAEWLLLARISHAVSMLKTPKVVPIEEKKTRVVARDTNGRRIIVAIGSDRLAIDFHTRITKLPPFTGDQPAPILPINKRSATKKRE
jgi:hypothetical protein